MERYALKTKTGEVINSISAVDKDHAVELFAEIKKISREDQGTEEAIGGVERGSHSPAPRKSSQRDRG